MRVLPEVRAPQTPEVFGRKILKTEIESGLAEVEVLYDELTTYTNILLGRADPPDGLDGVLDLMELAVAYYARAKEIESAILWEEQNRRVVRGSPHYKFRTGSLRSFMEMAKMLADLGSRRLTAERLLYDARYDAGGNGG